MVRRGEVGRDQDRLIIAARADLIHAASRFRFARAAATKRAPGRAYRVMTFLRIVIPL
jgi:hypothetical protein